MQNTQLDLFDLSNQITLITGGGKGLGRAIALGMAGAGATVIIIGRTLEPLKKTVDEIVESGGNAKYHQMDIQNDDAVKKLVEDTIAEHGRIDTLVNNVGVAPMQNALDISREEWHRVFDINLNSLFYLSRLVGEKMVAAKSGNIINISSILGKVAARYSTHYCATKAAIIQTTKALALEWGVHNVRVNCIAPGFFETEMTQALREDDKQHQFLIGKVPVKRLGRPGEIAGAAIFLASPAASYVTGTTLYVDGGYTIW